MVTQTCLLCTEYTLLLGNIVILKITCNYRRFTWKLFDSTKNLVFLMWKHTSHVKNLVILYFTCSHTQVKQTKWKKKSHSLRRPEILNWPQPLFVFKSFVKGAPDAHSEKKMIQSKNNLKKKAHNYLFQISDSCKWLCDAREHC